MTNCLPQQTAAHAVQCSQHVENARFAISLGAAFALLCAVVFDTPESQAANGLIELLFGGGGGGYYYAPAPSPRLGYGYGSRSYSHRRHARRSRNQYAHYGRSHYRVADRRSTERKRDVAESRAAERHHVAATLRRVRERNDMAANVPATARDFLAVTTPIERAAPSERKSLAPIETVSFSDANVSLTSSGSSRSAVCVRACDGFYFPITANAKGDAAQQSCERLCPGAETKAFLLPSGATTISDAVATKGDETYAQFVARLNPESGKSKSCACSQSAENLSDTSAFMSDLTLRPGDTVVTAQGVRVLRRGSRYPFKLSDFVSLAQTRALPRATRGALFAIDRALKIPYGRLAVASNSERRRHRANADL